MEEYNFYLMIKMKQKNFSFIIAFLLLSSMTFSMIVSVKADYTYDYDNTYFEYDVEVGDVFEYDLIYNYNFSASNAFYTEMNSWIVEVAANESVTLVDFDLEEIIGDIETILNLDYAMQIEITEMYSACNNNSNYYDDGWSTRYYDIFNGSLRVDLNEGADWETPEVVPIAKLEEIKVIAEKYLNATEYADFENEIDYLIDELEDEENQPDWDNSQFYGVQSNRVYYFENGTVDEDEPRELDNGTVEPTNPFPEFGGPEGIPFFYPTEMNFEEFYDYGTDMFKFELLYQLDQGYSIDPFVSTDTLQSILADAGVSDIYVDEKAVAIVWNIDNVDEDLLEDAFGENFTDDLADVGIADYSGSVAFAMEYDNDWALETFAVYAHIGLTLDTTGLEGAPDLNDEEVSLDFTFTFCRDGVKPPTEDDIKAGKVGENSGFEIPGYPMLIVGLFGMISIAALVVKHRK